MGSLIVIFRISAIYYIELRVLIVMRKSETISLFLDPELKRRIVDAAAREERNVSEFIRRLCAKHCDLIEQAENEVK